MLSEGIKITSLIKIYAYALSKMQNISNFSFFSRLFFRYFFVTFLI